MTAYTAWYDDVLPYVNGCPTELARQKIRQAAIEFCKRSRAWRYKDLTAIDAVASQQDYTIGAGATVGTLPAESVVAHVYQVNFDGERIDEATPAAFRALSETWFSDEGDPEYFTLFAEGVLSLWRIPSANAAGAIVLPEVALAPSQDSSGVDEAIWEHYRAAVATGARALIHELPGKPYTNVPEADRLKRDFIAAADAAGARASAGRGHGRIRTRTIIR